MKKLIALILALVCVLFLISCSQQGQQVTTNPTPIIKLDITVLTAWFDSEEFIPPISQSKMIEKMDTYTYNGKSICDATRGFYYDGQYGGGYAANGESFGFSNDYTASTDGKTAEYTNSFHTKVPLDGLTLPFGIEFDDALGDVMAKLGTTIRLPANFAPDGDADNTMTLYKDERYTLIFNDWALSKEPITTDIPYELIFTENYTFTREDDRVSVVTRTIKLAFANDEKALCEVNVKIQENYNLK